MKTNNLTSFFILLFSDWFGCQSHLPWSHNVSWALQPPTKCAFSCLGSLLRLQHGVRLLPRYVPNRRTSPHVPVRRGGCILGSASPHGPPQARHAWLLHPGLSQASEVSSASRQSHAQVPAKAQETSGQAGHWHGHLYSQVVLPMFPRSRKIY